LLLLLLLLAVKCDEGVDGVVIPSDWLHKTVGV
jgi:hypothetical protein